MLKNLSLEETEKIKEICLHFGIKEISKIKENTKGEFNRIFFITTNKEEKFVLRECCQDTTPENVAYEASLLNALHDQEFTIVPKLIKTLKNQQFKKIGGKLFVMQTFVEGESPYFWHSDDYTQQEFENFYRMLAQFHNVSKGISIESTKKTKPIDKKIEILKKNIMFLMQEVKKFDQEKIKEFLEENADFILNKANHCMELLKKYRYHELPKQIIHNDYHMGNISLENGEVTGIFDFDWVQEDTVHWDLAFSMMQVCSTWSKKHSLHKDKCRNALHIYNTWSNQPILSESEIKTVSLLLAVAEISNIKWSLSEYVAKKEDRYFDFLQHHISSLKNSEFDEIFI